MKPIQFLAWDTVIKDLVKVHALDFSQWWVQTGYKDGEGERNSFRNERTDRHKLMEFVGITDKNGQPIHDGFILQHEDGRIGRVTWVGEHCAYKILVTKPSSIYVSMEGDMVLEEWEIVGHIYANSDLLE
jgi:hypothetical protein